MEAGVASWVSWVCVIAYLVLGPFVGMLISGIDRKVTARMQGRVGPPILQPWYDVKKLFSKDKSAVNNVIDLYVATALGMAVVAGALFFAGGNLLIVIFLMSLSSVFVVVSAYSARSPYSDAGAQRENLTVMAYEPIMLLLPVAMYLITGSFNVDSTIVQDLPLIVGAPLFFLAYLFVMPAKLRKSPFDLSTSHHAHQELVKGLTTDMSGHTLAIMEIMDWYEVVLIYGIVGMFLVTSAWWSWILAIVVMVVCFLLEALVDNTFARVKWKVTLATSWVVTLVFCALNMAFLYFL